MEVWVTVEGGACVVTIVVVGGDQEVFVTVVVTGGDQEVIVTVLGAGHVVGDQPGCEDQATEDGLGTGLFGDPG